MTITYHGDYRNIECDECGDTLEEFHQDDFNDMIADAKARDWRLVNNDGSWSHYCPTCTFADKADPVDRAQRLLGVSRRSKATR